MNRSTAARVKQKRSSHGADVRPVLQRRRHADHRIHPQRQRRPPGRRHRAPGGRRFATTPGVRLLDHSVRRVAQPVGVHARRRRRPRSRPRRSRSSTSPSPPSTSGTHRGEHPRLGAVDVVPFVPIEGVTMAECVALAKDVAAAVAERFRVPVYLYEEAADESRRGRTSRTSAAASSKGSRPRWRQPGWAPDFGPPRRTRPPARRSSARACRSSPTTSTSTPTGSTSPRRSPPPSATAAAACAT